jgi:hypothetical protein
MRRAIPILLLIEARSMTFTSRQRAWYWTVLLTGGAVLGATGCSTAPQEKLVPVSGKVTVAGKSLTTGSVTFRPDASRGNTSPHQPTAPIDAEGHYELFVPPERKGAPPGWYKIVVFAYDNPRPGRLKSFINTKYQEEKTTPLTVEVIENPEPGRYDLNLTP